MGAGTVGMGMCVAFTIPVAVAVAVALVAMISIFQSLVSLGSSSPFTIARDAREGRRDGAVGGGVRRDGRAGEGQAREAEGGPSYDSRHYVSHFLRPSQWL